MDYEQEYKDALERAKDVPTMAFRNEEEVLTYIFPELRESEDEKIRKAIIEHFKQSETGFPGLTFGGYYYSDIFAYLEKQKINTDGDFGRGYNCGYECCLNSHGAEWFEKQKEQKTEPFSCGHENGSSEEPVLPGIEEPGIPGKDFIPAEWVDACEMYGKWKIVKQEQPDVDIRKELGRVELMGSNNASDMQHIASHFYELGLNARKEESK